MRKATGFFLISGFILLLLAWSGGLLPLEAQGSDVQVTSANPPEAEQGTVSLDVTIGGKSFDKGSVAKWFVTGTTNPGGVTVNSTRFVNSATLVANITVAGDAVIGKFDIAVTTSKGRTGKGTELFAVKEKGSGGGTASCPTLTPALTTVTSCNLMAPGCLDTSFGAGGVAILNTTGSTPLIQDLDLAIAVAIQPDGKIVVAGRSQNSAAGTPEETVILRYNPDGSLDSTFGSGGMVRLAMNWLNDMALQPDGKILLAGFGFSVVRLNTNGTVDVSFGNNGVASTTFGKGKPGKGAGSGGLAYTVGLQSDGKIIAAGESYPGGWGLARFNPDGSLDASFGNNGKVEPGGHRAYSIAFQVVPTGTGSETRILVGGDADAGSSGSLDFAVMRFTLSGALDTSFGPNGSGLALAEFCGGPDYLHGLGLDSAGNIVGGGMAALGSTVNGFPNYNFGVARFTANGLLDTSFGDGVAQRPGTSMVEVVGGYDTVWGFALQPDGKIVLSGRAETNESAFKSYVSVVRFNSNGTLDPTFGPGGVVATDAYAADNFGKKLALQADGKIVVVGSTAAYGGYNFLVVRYWQ